MIGRVRIAIVGFGLIGGSIARALGRREAAPTLGERIELAAWSRTADGPQAALAEGVVQRAPATLGETLRGAELVVLAAPPLACLELLDGLAGPLADALATGATVTDVAEYEAGRSATPGRRRSPCASSAGTRWPAASATGSSAAEADLFVEPALGGRLRGAVAEPGESTGSSASPGPAGRVRSGWVRPTTTPPLRRSATLHSSSPPRSSKR